MLLAYIFLTATCFAGGLLTGLLARGAVLDDLAKSIKF